ncbi:hypothetical protein AXF42_Ash021255 [Apostasia shenzhenica]|uniref:Uncharacterized protein n=1 Tax=Apostasia shenzhenica TaxID=1088818 RepID=A0A2H9ZUC4_9ASPA|nr:hypothetical protein AXF42_Ash021255 [Apostasia shenzhenica]
MAIFNELVTAHPSDVLSDVKCGQIFLSHRTGVPHPCVLDGDLRLARVMLGSVDQFGLRHVLHRRSATNISSRWMENCGLNAFFRSVFM